MSDASPPNPTNPAVRGAAVRIMERFLVGPSGVAPATGDGEGEADLGPSAAPSPRLDHDLDSRIPGFQALRAHTTGTPDVTIVILDGTPDLNVASLASDRISRVFPYWNARAEPISAADYALFREISQADVPRKERDRRFLDAFSRAQLFRIMGDRHATHITSVIAGRPGTSAPGIAPDCRVIVVPMNEGGSPEEYLSTLNLARGFEYARTLGADIIHCAACLPTQTDAPPELLAQAVQGCLEDDILVIAPVGNNAGDCRCIPAVLPGTLGVGALKADGTPFKFSNWGGHHAQNGIMTLGTEILGAQPGTDMPLREMGTSVAAPVITGLAALLMSLRSAQGQAKSGTAVREALLQTAVPCADGNERCLHGVLNLAEATARITGHAPRAAPDAIAPQSVPAPTEAAPPVTAPIPAPEPTEAAIPQQAAGEITQSTAHSGIVFGIGQLAFGFETTARRDDFQAAMERSAKAGGSHGTSIGDIDAVLDFLDQNPVERRHIIWLLEHDDAPIYALAPVAAYADIIYETLLNLMAGQHSNGDFGPHVERVSVPGRRLGKRQTLSSGDTVPVLGVADARGLFGWNVDGLAQDAARSVLTDGSESDVSALQGALGQLLRRVYFELHNLGQTSRDRAMNFAATNCFQVASVLAQVLDNGYVFENLVVTKSPLGRLRSDCWELSLTFVDPDDDHRAMRVFQFTVDVSDVQPVTVGAIRNWHLRRA